uniref:Ammonium transporter n=1 Tax=Clastoptera arizonana TaxID=38151 RepID=A0A1B6E7Z3_9HEMI
MEYRNTSSILTRIQNLENNVDDFFLISNGITVSFMQAGFACLEAGCVNSKNVTNIIMKNVLDTFLCAIGYWLIGYSLAYSPGNAFMGYSHWAGFGVEDSSMAFWFYQFIFAATAATIISGAVAERCNFIAYIVYSSVVSGFVYPIVSHWVWAEDGWLNKLGFVDFAGSSAVHLLAGVCSLVAAILLGPRIGRFENGKVVDKPGHSIPLIGIGGLILISGFMAFNCGSLHQISKPKSGEITARIIINTVMGGGGASIIILILCKTGLIGVSKWTFTTTLNATITGMVSVAAGANQLTTIGALLTGMCACFVYLLIRQTLIYFEIDDPLESVAVHLGGGLFGVISVSFFTRSGFMYGGRKKAADILFYNFIGAIAIIAWSGALSIILFGALKLTGYLRVSETVELEGLDITEHNEPAYPAQGWHRSPSLVSNYNINTAHLNQPTEILSRKSQDSSTVDISSDEFKNYKS